MYHWGKYVVRIENEFLTLTIYGFWPGCSVASVFQKTSGERVQWLGFSDSLTIGKDYPIIMVTLFNVCVYIPMLQLEIWMWTKQ